MAVLRGGGFPFNVSCDNLEGGFRPDRILFPAPRTCAGDGSILKGIPERPARLIKALQNYYHAPEITAECFPRGRKIFNRGKKMIAEFESRILALIDDVRWNTPVMMSCSPGYLRGHHTLAVAELEAGDDHSAEAIHDEVSRSSKSHPWQARLPRDQSLWFWECGTTCSSRLK